MKDEYELIIRGITPVLLLTTMTFLVAIVVVAIVVFIQLNEDDKEAIEFCLTHENGNYTINKSQSFEIFVHYNTFFCINHTSMFDYATIGIT